MRRFLYISYIIQCGLDPLDYSCSELDIIIANQMYEYVKEHSDNFKCSSVWAMTLWNASYFKFGTIYDRDRGLQYL